MLLYLLRHADAATIADTDDLRRLSAKGIEQARKVARFCAAQEIRPSLILTSPLRRAKETAVPVAEETGSELVMAPWLASGMEPETGLREVQAYRDRPSLMLAGHEPDFSQFIAFLLGLPGPTQFRVRKASLTLLEIDVFRAGAARLEFALPCRFL